MQQTRWVILFVLANFLISCSQPTIRPDLDCSIPNVTQDSSFKSDALTVKIYVDGSGSMLGYVKDGETNYVKVLRSIRSIFELSDNLNVEYFRHGNKVQKITSSEYYSYTGMPLFYDGTNSRFPGVSSPIDTAITPVSRQENKLTVLITDLEEDSGDVITINKKIQQYYLNQKEKNYAVGVWIVKSEFNGTLYIEEQNKLRTFPYNSGKQSEKMRPFYVLFIGPYKDIIYYFSKLHNSYPELVNNSKFIVFNGYNILTKVSDLQNPTVSTPLGVTRPFSLVKNGVSVIKGKSLFNLLEIDSDKKSSLTLNYSVPLAIPNYSLSIDPSSFTTKTEIKKFDKFTRKIQTDNQNPSLQQVLKLTNWQITDDNKLNFSTVIDPNSFPEPGIYLFTTDVFAKNLQSATWWKDWDWETRSSDHDGSKTHNVKFFLETLKHRIEDMNHDGWLVGRFCYAIQKN